MAFKRILLVCVLMSVFSDLLGFISDNQTPDVTPILPPDTLPFTVAIELADFSLPNGLHSYACGTYKGKLLLLAGRTNGLHGFGDDNNNFPPQQQNTTVYVIDFDERIVYSKSLYDATSGLTQAQIDLLSVTSPQSYVDNSKGTLYMTGGYGVDTTTGLFSTKPCLTAIDMAGLIKWVIHSKPKKTAAQSIRQIFDPLVQVTGGFMMQISPHLPTLLVFGQNFSGFYTDSSNGDYTQQVRAFQIIDNGKQLYILPQKMEQPNPNYRRRDLNVVPIVQKKKHSYQEALVALSGVFTLDGGAWTVPVVIGPSGSTRMADPSKPTTFKQGMNNYVCPTVGLFSRKTNDMYIISLGGISFGYFQNGSFQTDPELPFINQVTTIKIDEEGHFKQYIMANQYPVILSTGSNPGNQLLFGAGAAFFPDEDLPMYPSNEVFRLEKLGKSPVLLGYIVGGIQSTLPNTSTRLDSAASPYIFRVILTPK